MKTKIIQTKDYNKFNFFDSNRLINNTHVKKLMLSIKKDGLIEEILVNENYDIIDGQHRYMALKELGLPISAKIKFGTSIDSVLPCNLVRKDWKTEDFLHHYARKGYNDYLELEKIYKEEKRLTVTTLLELYTDSRVGAIKKFKLGEYKINLSIGNYIMNILTVIQPIMHAETYQQKFVRAFSDIVKRNQNFNIKRFVKQARAYKINIYRNESDTYKGIIEIYNKNLNNENRIF